MQAQEESRSSSDVQELVEDLPLPPKIDQAIQDLEALIGDLEEENLTEPLHVLKLHEVAEELADQLRDLRFRGSIGSKTRIIPNIVRAMKKVISFCSKRKAHTLLQPIGALRQLLRIIGNLVHTADLNRRQFLDADGAQALKMAMDLFLKLERIDPELCRKEIQIAILVGTNLSLDYQPAVVALAEAGLSALLSAIIEYAYSQRLRWMSLPLVLLEELVSVEAGWTHIPDSLLENLAKMIVHYATEVDMGNIEKNDSDPNLQILAMCSHLLDTIVEHASLFRFTSWLFVNCDHNYCSFTDDPPTPMWMRLSMFIRSHSQLKPSASGDDLVSLLNVVKAQIIRAIVVAVAFSGIALHVSMTMMDLLVDWIMDPQVRDDRPDLVIMIGLWLGNLACDDESCRYLVDECEILNPMTAIFEKWAPSCFDSQSDDSSSAQHTPGEQAQVLHAWCGLARNLAVADTYKGKLGELGLVTYALECFRPEFDIVEPLNGTAAALLRHLCRNHVANVERVMESNLISSVVSLARRAEQPYLMLESTRLLSVLTNTATQMDPSRSKTISNALKILYSEATVDALARFAYVSVTSHQLVLINEALISLALLAVRPDLVHSLCNNLLKVRDPMNNENNEDQECKEKNKNKYRNALEALLSIWIPSPDTKEEGFKEVKKEENTTNKSVQDVHLTEEERHILELFGNVSSSSVQDDDDDDDNDDQKKNTSHKYPIQMKENLKVVLIQLGKQCIKSKTNSTDSNNNNGQEVSGNLVGNDQQGEKEKIEEIRKSLVNHINLYHCKKQQEMDSNQPNDKQEEHQEDSKTTEATSHNGVNEQETQDTNANESKSDDEISRLTDHLKISNSDNNNNNTYGNGRLNLNKAIDPSSLSSSNENDVTGFYVLDVLQTWNLLSSTF